MVDVQAIALIDRRTAAGGTAQSIESAGWHILLLSNLLIHGLGVVRAGRMVTRFRQCGLDFTNLPLNAHIHIRLAFDVPRIVTFPR